MSVEGNVSHVGIFTGHDQTNGLSKEKLEIIAIFATVLSLSGYIPVAVDLYLNPSADIKIITYIVYALGISSLSLWIAFGVGVKSKRIYISSSVALTVIIFILLSLIIYSNIIRQSSTSSSSMSL